MQMISVELLAHYFHSEAKLLAIRAAHQGATSQSDILYACTVLSGESCKSKLSK